MSTTSNLKLTTTQVLEQIKANIDNFTDSQLNTINDIVTLKMFGQDNLLLDDFDDLDDSELNSSTGD